MRPGRGSRRLVFKVLRSGSQWCCATRCPTPRTLPLHRWCHKGLLSCSTAIPTPRTPQKSGWMSHCLPSTCPVLRLRPHLAHLHALPQSHPQAQAPGHRAGRERWSASSPLAPRAPQRAWTNHQRSHVMWVTRLSHPVTISPVDAVKPGAASALTQVVTFTSAARYAR